MNSALIKRSSTIFFLISLITLLTGSSDSHTYDSQLSDYVNKIIRLIEWKDDLKHQSFEIGYIGDHHLSKLSNHDFQGQTYHGKPVKVINYHSLHQLENHPPRLLYIGKHKTHNLDLITQICEEKHIFSISDDQVKRNQAPLILLHIQNDGVEMIVNKTEAERQLFKLSYHLLRAATEVK